MTASNIFMPSPKVSILLSVYNGMPYVEEAIDSILNQDFNDFELLIIDDASKDISASVIKRYSDSRIRFFENKHNKGLISNLNFLASQAKAPLLARHDADDISHPARLGLQYELMSQHPDLSLCGTNVQVINAQGDIYEEWFLPEDDMTIRERLHTNNVFCHGSTMFRKQAFEQAGAYRAAFRYCEDYDLWLRLAETGHMAMITKPLYKLRRHNTNITSRRALEQLDCGLLAMLTNKTHQKNIVDAIERDFESSTRTLLNRHFPGQICFHRQWYIEQLTLRAHKIRASGARFLAIKTALQVLRIEPKLWRVRWLLSLIFNRKSNR